ncbi:histidine kinase [Pseudomonas sp. SC11]|uniref:histidine kinase n=1 Tax=Pseudomonas sp. SC11 TaxID=326927 RepID=UPI00399BD9C5
MERGPSNSDVLREFLPDAQALLKRAQECLQHLALIGNDPDACRCLDECLHTLAQGASASGMREISCYSTVLRQLLQPSCEGCRLPSGALSALAECLDLLDWQLELVDPHTGQLHLDGTEQQLLVGALASALDQPCPSPASATRSLSE